MPKVQTTIASFAVNTITKRAATKQLKDIQDEASSSTSVVQPEASTSSATILVTQTETHTGAIVTTTLKTLEYDTMGRSWIAALEGEFTKPYFRSLKNFLVAEHKRFTVYPELDNIYSWSRLTPLDTVKVVILGQDPYHNVGQAHGLSFSVLPPTRPPGSLLNIYKQLKTDFPSFAAPKTGDLTPLAKLGVLWLNTSLTVRAHKAGSHAKKGWETFTAQALRAVISRPGNQRGVVFLAWGLPAQKTISSLGIDKTKHLVLSSAHPSPLSAHRGFTGNAHFRKTNEWLVEKYGEGEGIDWSVLSATPA